MKEYYRRQGMTEGEVTVFIVGHSISPSFGFRPCFRSKSNFSKLSIRRLVVDGSAGAETVFYNSTASAYTSDIVSIYVDKYWDDCKQFVNRFHSIYKWTRFLFCILVEIKIIPIYNFSNPHQAAWVEPDDVRRYVKTFDIFRYRQLLTSLHW